MRHFGDIEAVRSGIAEELGAGAPNEPGAALNPYTAIFHGDRPTTS